MILGMTLYEILNIIILLILIGLSVAIALSRNLLTATIYFSVFSLLMALIYLILKAPDVAITEAAIGAGITTILFLAALLLTGYEEKPKKISKLSVMVFVFTLSGLLYMTAGFPQFGNDNTPANQGVGKYYIENTENQLGIPNMVTGVLASYRGYDTLGETFVIFTACMAVFLLLDGKLSRKREE